MTPVIPNCMLKIGVEIYKNTSGFVLARTVRIKI